MILEIEDLNKQYDGETVLHDLTLFLEDIQALAVIGPSGGGKTTLLRILAGLEEPDSGSVYLNGQQLSFDKDEILQYRKSVGVVFQAYNLFPHLSAERNITLPLEKIHGYSSESARERTEELLTHFRLEEHAAKMPYQLSGGQQQRIAIARALAINPLCLLFDEPTSALDPELTGEVLDMISLLKSEGKDLIIVTHEIEFARHAADYVLYLEGGQIVEQGPPKELLYNPETKELKRFLERIIRNDKW